MEEVMENFKVDVEKMLDDWYEELEQLVCDAMFNLSFFGSDSDEKYLELQDIMIKVLQERLGCTFKEGGESH